MQDVVKNISKNKVYRDIHVEGIRPITVQDPENPHLLSVRNPEVVPHAPAIVDPTPKVTSHVVCLYIINPADCERPISDDPA